MKYFLILLTVLSVNKAGAQSAEDSVKMVITTMFTAMNKADATLLKSCFADSIIFQTVGTDKHEGKVVIRNQDAADFVSFIGKQKAGMIDERIAFETVIVNGSLAIVWTPYNFYYNGKFIHCGVNSFQLVRFKEGWKIQYLIDTRTKAGCKEQ